jgi:hypothetical protein
MKSCDRSAPKLPPARYALLVLTHPCCHGLDGLRLEGKEELFKDRAQAVVLLLVSVWRNRRSCRGGRWRRGTRARVSGQTTNIEPRSSGSSVHSKGPGRLETVQEWRGVKIALEGT